MSSMSLQSKFSELLLHVVLAPLTGGSSRIAGVCLGVASSVVVAGGDGAEGLASAVDLSGVDSGVDSFNTVSDRKSNSVLARLRTEEG
jgi:hypothetical protein